MRYLNLCRAILLVVLIPVSARADEPTALTIELKSSPHDAQTVNALVRQLASDDVAVRDRAGPALEDLPCSDLPLIKQCADDAELPKPAKDRLTFLLPRITTRDRNIQNAIKVEANIAAWSATNAWEYYQKDGHAKASYDAVVQKAFELDGRRFASHTSEEFNQITAEEKKAFDAAIAAGCDDPDVLEVDANFSLDNGVSMEVLTPLLRKAKDSSTNGKISPYGDVMTDVFLLFARSDGFDGGLFESNSDSSTELMSDMVGHYAKAMRGSGVPADARYFMASEMMRTAKLAQIKLKRFFDAVYEPLEKSIPKDPRLPGLKGTFYVDWAWEARGGGYADTVGQDGWKKFSDRLDVARDLLTQAWNLDPTNPLPPEEMLCVTLGQGSDRSEMETWFKRAMDADPDNYTACGIKSDFLLPKWYGSKEAALEFGHECFDGRNWHNTVAFTLLDTYDHLATGDVTVEAMLKDPKVWADYSATYTAFLNAYPNDNRRRSNFAYYASLAGQWNTAAQLFQQLGDKAHSNLISDEKLADFKKQAQENAR